MTYAYRARREERKKMSFRQLAKHQAILQGQVNILAGLLTRGFWGRWKLLLFGR